MQFNFELFHRSRGLPGGARGACSEILGAPEPPFEPLSQKYGAQGGGALGRPEIASEALEAILENVKKRLFFYCFEPLGPSNGAKGGEKEAKRGDLNVRHKQAPRIKWKNINMTTHPKAKKRPRARGENKKSVKKLRLRLTGGVSKLNITKSVVFPM